MRAALSTLTTRGRAFLSAGTTSAVCAILLGQKDLLRVGVLLILLPVVTAILANRSRYRLSCSREIAPARVQAGQTAQVSLRLENPGRVPTGLMLLEDQVPYVLGSRPRFVLDQLRPRWDRTMSYLVRSEVRGRFAIGPLTVRISDPFGFVELTRAFTSRAVLVVTPVVVDLASFRLSGEWSGTGDNRPRAFAAAGTEDVTVREYRLGDDLRRIHWRSTARTDELMVRREEQPHQSRATIVLDTRAGAHRGSGPASSFEYAVSACASIGAYLASQGFVVRMLTDDVRASEATWHDRGISGPVEVQLLLESLAVITTSTRSAFSPTSTEHNAAGLLVAILGDCSSTDVASLSALRVGSTRALAIVLDVGAWARGDSRGSGSPAEQAANLRAHGWTVVVAGTGDRLGQIWADVCLPPALRSHTVEPLVQTGPAA
ncbi:MAG: DUF58 domain-containing protein [Nocardioidaceae bacterium]|nr:DUF58 domain-containing protein [Nocardioidaceae bacterium]